MKEVLQNPFLDFLESENGKKIKEIFLYIFEISEEWDILVLLTRKGYWLFRMLCWYWGLKIPDSKKYLIMSDRKVDKGDIQEVRELLGKQDAVIYLVDDTLSTGLTANRVYRIFNEEWPQAHVTPLTCFIAAAEDGSKMHLIDKSILGEENEEVNQRFLRDLSYFHLSSLAELGKLSYDQAVIAQQELVPYVVDLPFLVDKSFCATELVSPFSVKAEDCVNSRFSIVDRDILEGLLRGNAVWSFYDNSYCVCKVYDKRPIRNGIFIYSGKKLESILKSSALNMVIKFRYEYMEDHKAALMFTPFAMLKSADFMDIWNAFKAIYEYLPGDNTLCESEYYHYIRARFIEKGPENVGLNIFRTVIYFFSYYLGKIFSEWIREDFQIELKVDESFMHENSGREFISFVHELGKMDLESYYKIFDRITPWKANELVVIEKTEDELPQSDIFMSKDEMIYNAVYMDVIRRKRKGKLSELFTIEDMEEMLKRSFEFKSEEELRLVLTKILLRMLDISVIGNRVWYKNGKIFRGFRYGENSDIIVPFFNPYIHYGVDLFYRKLDWINPKEKNTRYHQRIAAVIDSIADMLREKGYMGYVITEVELKYNKLYYKGCDNEVQGLIQNKSFLLEHVNTDEVIFKEIAQVVNEFEL